MRRHFSGATRSTTGARWRARRTRRPRLTARAAPSTDPVLVHRARDGPGSGGTGETSACHSRFSDARKKAHNGRGWSQRRIGTHPPPSGVVPFQTDRHIPSSPVPNFVTLLWRTHWRRAHLESQRAPAAVEAMFSWHRNSSSRFLGCPPCSTWRRRSTPACCARPSAAGPVVN